MWIYFSSTHDNAFSDVSVWLSSYFLPLCSPTKSEFIRAKYQMLAFVHKLPCRDDDGVTTKDLSKVRAQYFTTDGLSNNEFWLLKYICKNRGCFIYRCQWEAPHINVHYVHVHTQTHSKCSLTDKTPRQETISMRQQDVIMITNAEELHWANKRILFLDDIESLQPHTLCFPLSSSISNSTQVCEREV